MTYQMKYRNIIIISGKNNLSRKAGERVGKMVIYQAKQRTVKLGDYVWGEVCFHCLEKRFTPLLEIKNGYKVYKCNNCGVLFEKNKDSIKGKKIKQADYKGNICKVGDTINIEIQSIYDNGGMEFIIKGNI